MEHLSQRAVLKVGHDKCFIKCLFLLEGHKVINLVIFDSALSLELAFLIIFKTCVHYFLSIYYF